jgi:hypothetical protein
MNRISRAAVATAMAAAVALGASAPAAVAGPPEHAKGAHAKASKAEKAKGPKAAKADRMSALLERKLDRQITRKSAFLTRIAESDRLASLEETYATLVGANIAADLVHLEELRTQVSDDAATFEVVRGLSVDVRAVRPQVYNQVISQIRRATAMQALAGEVPEAEALLTGALDSLSTFTAITPRNALRDVHSLLAQAAALLEAVEVPEESDVPETGTDESAPVVPEPPVEQDPAV